MKEYFCVLGGKETWTFPEKGRTNSAHILEGFMPKLLRAEIKGKVRYHFSYWLVIAELYIPKSGKEEQTGSLRPRRVARGQGNKEHSCTLRQKSYRPLVLSVLGLTVSSE